jgi:hypothetical protein
MANFSYITGLGGNQRPTTRPNGTYGQYNYYTTPQTLGRPIGGSNTSGAGTSETSTGNADAEGFFKEVMAGKRLPFGPQQQAAQLSQASDMTSAAESAQNQALMAAGAAGGASAGDPSMQAAKMNNMARRQVGNQTAARDIQTRADQTNFGAQMDAAGQLNNNAMQRAQWAQSQGVGSPGLAYSPYGSGHGGGGGGQSRPSQTVGAGLFGHNYFTNSKDPSGQGVPGQLAPYPWLQKPNQRPVAGSLPFGPAVNTGSQGPLKYDDSMWN